MSQRPRDQASVSVTSKTAAIVLAGGEARRLGGQDKPLLRISNTSMIARIIETLRADGHDIAISANGDPARFAELALPVLADGRFAGEGPLAGVLAGMDWAATRCADDLLTVPGDTPFAPAGLAAALAPPPACAESAGRPHWLVALWPLDCRDKLRQVLSVPGRRDIASFARLINMRRVDLAGAKWDAFFNVNTPQDLVTARAIAGGER